MLKKLSSKDEKKLSKSRRKVSKSCQKVTTATSKRRQQKKCEQVVNTDQFGEKKNFYSHGN